ncbi:glycosyltransferase [Calothrix sp. 336/3]|uniref:glycosyltransferase n=1 Tax=Calothrix sp. 336/3 TaxID=1337936 RepID=UPI00062447E5|nr:glycosyltransferase [Calothrix sp. 336/3]AKG22682.1 glucosyl transferase [Calothrix sp. 336/3]
MIFVTVGTEKYPFNRLINWISFLLREGLIQEEVIIQYGSCTVLSPGVRVYKHLDENHFNALLKEARIIISHCGEGTFLMLEELEVPYILVPRSYEYKEHVDNHQVELATVLEELGVPIAWSPGDLVQFICEPQRLPISHQSLTSQQLLCSLLEQQLLQSQKLELSNASLIDFTSVKKV